MLHKVTATCYSWSTKIALLVLRVKSNLLVIKAKKQSMLYENSWCRKGPPFPILLHFVTQIRMPRPGERLPLPSFFERKPASKLQETAPSIGHFTHRYRFRNNTWYVNYNG